MVSNLLFSMLLSEFIYSFEFGLSFIANLEGGFIIFCFKPMFGFMLSNSAVSIANIMNF